MPSLYVIQGRDQGTRFELTLPQVQLGRDAESDFQIQDTEVSRRHALLRVTDEGYELVDQHSSNGTFVNDRQIELQALRSGDRVRLGRTQMIYTGTTVSFGEHQGGPVDIIVEQSRDESRILHTVPEQTESRLSDFSGSEESPWLARARSNLQIMYRTALAVSHTLDIDQLLGRIMELIFEWVEADRGCIMLLDRNTEAWLPKVRLNRRDSQSDEAMVISQTILEYVRLHCEGVLTSDAREDGRFDAARSILNMGIREAICVPMQGRYGMVGVIYIDTYTPPSQAFQGAAANKFSQDHLKLMVAIGHQAALAIEDTTYYSALVQAERLAAVGQTIASLSHHIKNILQGIRGGSYLIDEGLRNGDSDVVRKGWGIVEKNQERISGLVMDMLSYSKERKPDKRPSELNSVVDEIVQLMQARALEANVTLSLTCQPEIPEMVFDLEGLHRAVLNVVSNGIDAAEERDDGRVEVTTSWDAEADRLRVLVEDNGPGIPEEKRSQIFTVFESDKGNRGTGLGLPVSQKILREHGGDILVHSELGKGSRFELVWPAVPAASDFSSGEAGSLEQQDAIETAAMDPETPRRRVPGAESP